MQRQQGPSDKVLELPSPPEASSQRSFLSVICLQVSIAHLTCTPETRET